MRSPFLSKVAFLLYCAPAALAAPLVVTETVYVSRVTAPMSQHGNAIASTEAFSTVTLSSQAGNPTSVPSSLATTSISTSSLSTFTQSSSTAVSAAASTDTYAASAQTSEPLSPDGASGSSVDNAAGASGSDQGSFSISKGGLAAIIAVVVIVAVFGIASTILFVLAKRRQWNVRQSIVRASRRLTGRAGVSKAERQSRRGGVRMGSPTRPGVRAIHPPGHKRGLVVDVKAKDVEKGGLPERKKREVTWVKKLWGPDWK